MSDAGAVGGVGTGVVRVRRGRARRAARAPLRAARRAARARARLRAAAAPQPASSAIGQHTTQYYPTPKIFGFFVPESSI